MRNLGVRPGLSWRIARRVIQALAFFAIAVAPFLGGWQRLERNDLSSWARPETELLPALREHLPRGDSAGAAHDNNHLLGGGVAAEYLDIPAVDPVAGVFTLMTGAPTGRALIALAIPLFLALLFGRVFCGWFCPFGTLSRVVGWITERMAWLPRPKIPARRPVRFVILGAGLFAGLLGTHVVLYLALPHLLVQQTVYAAWLLGGGGAALGLLIGLVLAGVVAGPTTYCAALCPTGAALRLLGQKKIVHLQITDPEGCPKKCQRCSLTCWIQLDPASGDPGPDCDLCARCVPQCPKANLRVGLRRRRASLAPLLIVLVSLGATSSAHAEEGRANLQPELTLAAERIVEGVTIAIDVVDQTGVQLIPDSDEHLSGSDISVFLARGERGESDERGLLPTRDAYDGPLTIRIEHRGRERTLSFDGPNEPRSTPRRAIYRERVPIRLVPGDVVVIESVDGWFATPQRFEVPSSGVDASAMNVAIFGALGVLIFLGLLWIALSVRQE